MSNRLIFEGVALQHDWSIQRWTVPNSRSITRGVGPPCPSMWWLLRHHAVLMLIASRWGPPVFSCRAGTPLERGALLGLMVGRYPHMGQYLRIGQWAHGWWGRIISPRLSAIRTFLEGGVTNHYWRFVAQTGRFYPAVLARTHKLGILFPNRGQRLSVPRVGVQPRPYLFNP